MESLDREGDNRPRMPVAEGGDSAPSDTSATSMQEVAGAGSLGLDLSNADAVRDALVRQGWKQGAVLSDDAFALVQRIPFAPMSTADERYFGVVISQDCDVIQGNCLAEPGIEIAILRGLKRLDNSFRNLANPRTLHFEMLDDSRDRHAVEANVWSRGFIPREELTQRSPSSDWSVPAAEMGLLADLFARRYTREAFPDEFMRRFAVAEPVLAQLVTRNQDTIHDLYLKVEPFDELPRTDPDQNPYSVTMYVLIANALAADAGARKVFSKSHVPNVKKALRSCSGIEVEDVIVIDTDEMSVGLVAELVRWDHDPLRAKLDDKARGAHAPGLSSEVLPAAPRATPQVASSSDEMRPTTESLKEAKSHPLLAEQPSGPLD
jgi:hypothetical protein